MIVTQRFPNFMTGFTSEVTEVNSKDDFNNIKFVKRWASDPKFVRFSISRTHRPQKILMVEFSDDSYWAIGWIKGEIIIDLPEWKKNGC